MHECREEDIYGGAGAGMRATKETRLDNAAAVQLESRRLFLRVLWGRAEVVPAAGKAGTGERLLVGCAYSG
jgi:hypothetical protein